MLDMTASISKVDRTKPHRSEALESVENQFAAEPTQESSLPESTFKKQAIHRLNELGVDGVGASEPTSRWSTQETPPEVLRSAEGAKPPWFNTACSKPLSRMAFPTQSYLLWITCG